MEEFFYPLPTSSGLRPRVTIRAIEKVKASTIINLFFWRIDPEAIWSNLEEQIGARIAKYFSRDIPLLSLEKHYFITLERSIKELDYSAENQAFVLEATIWQVTFNPDIRIKIDEENYIMRKALEMIVDSSSLEEKIKIAKVALREVEKLRK